MNKKSNVKGLNREVYALLSSDNKDASLMPSDFSLSSKFGFPPFGYKVTKANLSIRTVSKWKWTQFTNPARSDGFLLNHWRPAKESKEYPFARFNKTVTLPDYTDDEYEKYFQNPNWSKEETDYLLSLCKKYDTRFIVIHDRWDSSIYKDRTIEEIKDRYYSVCNIYDKIPTKYQKLSKYTLVYDAEHERIRKDQLIKLYNRTPDQVKEEEYLIEEMRKIELRKKERDRRASVLKKLIDSTNDSLRKNDPIQSRVCQRSNRKKNTQLRGTRMSEVSYFDLGGIKFPEPKAIGVSLRSTCMKMPASVGARRSKAIDEMLKRLNIFENPMPFKEVCREFNDLRNKMYMLYELKTALSYAEFENQFKHQNEQMDDSMVPSTPLSAISLPDNFSSTFESSLDSPFPSSRNCDSKKISEVIETNPVTMRKRKAAIEQENMMKKLNKKKTLN